MPELISTPILIMVAALSLAASLAYQYSKRMRTKLRAGSLQFESALDSAIDSLKNN